MNLIFNTMLDKNAIKQLEITTSHEVIEERGKKFAEVLKLKEKKTGRNGESRYETEWGDKSPSGLYWTIFNLILETNEIGKDYKYGIYNSYKEGWWSDDDDEPMIFDDYISATNYLNAEKEKSEIDCAEGFVRIFRGLIPYKLIKQEMIVYSTFGEEQSAFDGLMKVCFDVARALAAFGPDTSMSTEICGCYYYLFKVGKQYELRFSPVPNRNNKSDYFTLSTINGVGADDLEKTTAELNVWLKNPTILY